MNILTKSIDMGPDFTEKCTCFEDTLISQTKRIKIKSFHAHQTYKIVLYRSAVNRLGPVNFTNSVEQPPMFQDLRQEVKQDHLSIYYVLCKFSMIHWKHYVFVLTFRDFLKS